MSRQQRNNIVKNIRYHINIKQAGFKSQAWKMSLTCMSVFFGVIIQSWHFIDCYKYKNETLWNVAGSRAVSYFFLLVFSAKKKHEKWSILSFFYFFPIHCGHQAGGAHKRSWFRNEKAIGLRWDVQSGGHADETENLGWSGFHTLLLAWGRFCGPDGEGLRSGYFDSPFYMVK